MEGLGSEVCAEPGEMWQGKKGKRCSKFKEQLEQECDVPGKGQQSKQPRGPGSRGREAGLDPIAKALKALLGSE